MINNSNCHDSDTDNDNNGNNNNNDNNGNNKSINNSSNNNDNNNNHMGTSLTLLLEQMNKSRYSWFHTLNSYKLPQACSRNATLA